MSNYNYNRLRGKIVETFGTLEKFARSMKQTPTTIGRKLQGKSEWSQTEISNACVLLKIPFENIPQYFFCIKG